MTPQQLSKLYDYNALYFGYPIEKLMENAGKGLAQVLLQKYGSGKRIGFFCGTGNNGGDGLVAARYLQKKMHVQVFLVGDPRKIRSKEASKNWGLFKGTKQSFLTTKNLPQDLDIVVDCMLGTGVQGKLRKPYTTIVKKLNKIKAKKVAVDIPTPGFKSDFNISMMVPKVKGASVVDIGYPKDLAQKIGVGEVKLLHQAAASSRKGDNGKLLIIGGSKTYHGAPLLAASIASRIVDLVYFASTAENNELLQKMKSKLCEFIAVAPERILEVAKKVDAILVGPGMEIGEDLTKLIKSFPKIPIILDAGGLITSHLALITSHSILTPHQQEFKRLFGLSATKENLRKMAKKYNCTIVLKGATDYVADKELLKLNETGNAGMTKGGTGDVLAGLIAALACKNSPFLAASAGVFLNGLAAERLAKRVSTHFNASDLMKEIPRTMKWCEDF